VVCAAACLVAGCSDFEFYWQGHRRTDRPLARAKPITDVIATTPDPALKRRLVRAQEIRAFASRELGLPDNRSYTSYADLERPYAVWNVFATPELSLTAAAVVFSGRRLRRVPRLFRRSRRACGSRAPGRCR
jgi:predicted aminopeptidase